MDNGTRRIEQFLGSWRVSIPPIGERGHFASIGRSRSLALRFDRRLWSLSGAQDGSVFPRPIWWLEWCIHGEGKRAAHGTI